MPFTSKILRNINCCDLTDIEAPCLTHREGLLQFKDKQGRYRFLKLKDGHVVSGLFVEKYGKRGYIILGVYTVLNSRRKGYARELLEIAKKKLKNVRHNSYLTREGKEWAYSVEGITN